MKTIPFTVLIIYLFTAIPALSQDTPQDSTLYEVITLNGNEFVGYKISENNIQIVLQTSEYGVITIQKDNIRKLTPIDTNAIKKSEYWFENLQATRYFWSPNGYGLKKGEGYYQNVWILFNQYSVGITDHISIGAGLIPTFLFAEFEVPVWVTPKFSIPVVRDKLNIGGGALIGGVTGVDRSAFGILYGHTTFGSKDKNINIGVGWGFIDGQLAEIPTFTLSGMYRLNRKTYLLSENYFINTSTEGFSIVMLGARSLINRVSLDYGLVMPLVYDLEFIALPWLGLVIPIGNKPK